MPKAAGLSMPAGVMILLYCRQRNRKRGIARRPLTYVDEPD
jgi:hypothetical protein